MLAAETKITVFDQNMARKSRIQLRLPSRLADRKRSSVPPSGRMRLAERLDLERYCDGIDDG